MPPAAGWTRQAILLLRGTLDTSTCSFKQARRFLKRSCRAERTNRTEHVSNSNRSQPGGTTIDEFLIGGNNVDLTKATAFDSQGFAYLTGITASPQFPTSSSAVQRKYRGDGQLFDPVT